MDVPSAPWVMLARQASAGCAVRLWRRAGQLPCAGRSAQLPRRRAGRSLERRRHAHPKQRDGLVLQQFLQHALAAGQALQRPCPGVRFCGVSVAAPGRSRRRFPERSAGAGRSGSGEFGDAAGGGGATSLGVSCRSRPDRPGAGLATRPPAGQQAQAARPNARRQTIACCPKGMTLSVVTGPISRPLKPLRADLLR